MANFLGLKGLIDFREKPAFCPCVDEVHEVDDMSRLVQLVYSPDEKTGLASSDLNVLVSDSVNPQIAEWVRSQILRPVGFSPSSIRDGQQIDDDTLFALTRDMNESQSSYVERVNGLLKQWNTNNEGD